MRVKAYGQAIVATAVGVTLLGIGVPASAAPERRSAAGPVEFHGTGLQPPTTRLAAARGLTAARKIGAAVATEAVPTSVDLTPYAVTPGNQGQVGSCVAWSLGYTMQGWYGNYQKHTGHPFAPMYVYTQINGGRDAGATIPSAWAVLESQGIAEQAVYTQGNFDWRTQPLAAQRTNAALHKTASHSYLFTGDNQGTAAQTALKAALANGQPVEIGMPVHSGFTALSASNNVWRLSNTTGKSLLGYHAIVAVGYDSTGIRIENSWGTGWGAAGFATLGWDFVNRYLIEASVGTGFALTGQPTAPAVTKLSKTSVSIVGGETLTVTGERLSTVGSSGALLINVADNAVTGALTITGRTSTTLTVRTPALSLAGTYRLVLTGSSGSSPLTDPAATITAVAPPAPAVSAVTPANVAIGGANVTVAVTGLATVPAATGTVALVGLTDPTFTATGQITARTAAALTVTLPAAPAGSYRIVVTGAGGASVAQARDRVTYLTPYTPAVDSGRLVSAAGGTALPIGGTGFGSGTAQFAANKITATLNDRAATVTWVSDTQLKVAVPAGTPGAAATVVLFRAGVAGPADGTARYAAVITGSSAPFGPSAGGWTTTVSGTGLARSGNWSLVDSTGTPVATLPVVTTADALNGSTGAVFLSGSAAKVKLPAAPGGRPGVYALTFTPDQGAYPGAVTALSSRASVTYTEVG